MYLRILMLFIIIFTIFGSGIAMAQTNKECKKLISNRCSKKNYKNLKDRAACYKKIHKKLTKGCKKLNRKLYLSAKKKLKSSKPKGSFFGGFTYLIIFFVLLILWLQVCMYGIFSKARYNPWLAFVPFYNSYIFHKISSCWLLISS